MDTAESPRFITILFSHYCEKARWAMDRRGFPYCEEPHVPGFHLQVTRRLGAPGSVPVLRTAKRTLPESTDIVFHADEHGGPGERLLPGEAPARADCLALEEYFDEKLGPHTRRLMYYHVLQDRGVALRLLRAGCPGWEQASLPWVFPVLRAVMRRMMRIDAEGAARSQQEIENVFAAVATRLADGRRYLVGERFTAADLSFAALAAPVLWPKEYGGGVIALPELSMLPPRLTQTIEELRPSAAGTFALRLYQEERAGRGHDAV